MLIVLLLIDETQREDARVALTFQAYAAPRRAAAEELRPFMENQLRSAHSALHPPGPPGGKGDRNTLRGDPMTPTETGRVGTSAGDEIAYDVAGYGPTVVLIGGTVQLRATDPPTRQLVVELIDRDIRAVHYDRPG